MKKLQVNIILFVHKNAEKEIDNYIEFRKRNGMIIESDFIEKSYDNTWVTVCFCYMCGKISGPYIKYNVYKLKGLFFCGPCFETIQKRSEEKGVKLEEGELYWEGNCSELK